MNNENEIFTNSDIDSSIKMVTAGIMLNGTVNIFPTKLNQKVVSVTVFNAKREPSTAMITLGVNDSVGNNNLQCVCKLFEGVCRVKPGALYDAVTGKISSDSEFIKQVASANTAKYNPSQEGHTQIANMIDGKLKDFVAESNKWTSTQITPEMVGRLIADYKEAVQVSRENEQNNRRKEQALHELEESSSEIGSDDVSKKKLMAQEA